MNVMTIDHYRDIGSYLSKFPKITMARIKSNIYALQNLDPPPSPF